MTASPDAPLTTLITLSDDGPTTSDWVDVLEGLPLFASISKRQLRKIAELAEFRNFPPQSVVVQTGDAADGFYVILAGSAKSAGRPNARTLRTGDYFGEMALLDGGPRSATIVSIGELQTMRLPREPFLRLLEREPQIAIAIIGELAGRIRRLETPTVA
jgi:CRP/FNR family cyclic AMP-dependent transcriptional regulator